MVNKNLTEEKTLEELRNWFVNNPKLPEEIDEQLLKRFLKCMHCDVEDTKRLIEHNYALRNKNPHIFIDRDPCDESVQEFHELQIPNYQFGVLAYQPTQLFYTKNFSSDIIALPGLTPENHRILFFRLNECDPSKMNSVLESKVFYMMADCRFTMLDVDEKTSADADVAEMNESEIEPQMAEGDVQIIDIGNYSLSHLARISFFTLRTHLKFLQEAYPVRLKAMHIINCPSFLDKMITIVRPFIRDEVYNMTHFHTSGLESLYEHVPKHMLPNEYGGAAGTIAELKAKWAKILSQKRNYLIDPKHWKVEQTRSRWSFW